MRAKAGARGAATASMLTVGEAADLLHVHPNTLRRWEALGMIQARRVGPRHDRRFLQSEVERLLEAPNGQGEPPIPTGREGSSPWTRATNGGAHRSAAG